MFELLAVEDNPADIVLIQEHFAEPERKVRVHFATDGNEAMDFLRRVGKFADAPRPDLILLDLNLPKKDGREVLKETKKDDALSSIPVVVLTTSSSQSDVRSCYESHANCYFSKPLDLNAFNSLMEMIEDCWLRSACMPRKN